MELATRSFTALLLKKLLFNADILNSSFKGVNIRSKEHSLSAEVEDIAAATQFSLRHFEAKLGAKVFKVGIVV